MPGAMIVRRAGPKGGTVSLRHAGVCFALTLVLLPWSARAQQQRMECTDDSSPCATGGPCPLKNLPYEEFITAPPTSRGGRNIPPVSDRPFDPESGDRMLVKGFVVDGVTPNPESGVTPETVQAAANAAFARETNGAPEGRMTVGHMVKVADEVTNFYRSKGYLVAKAFLPVQTVGPDALVHIGVLEGKISEVAVEGAKSYSPKVLLKPTAGLVGTVPTRDSVETALLYAQDYPGVRLFGTFKPGAQSGDTKLVLQVLDEDHLGFAVGADNYGTKFTGLYRTRLDVAWKNPIGWGDQFNVALLQSLAPAKTTYGSASYHVPVGPRGFQIYGEGSRNGFSVDEPPFDTLQLKGTITAYTGGMDWRYKRSRFANSKVLLSYSQKQSKLTGLGGLPIADDKYGLVQLESDMDRIDLRFKGVDQLTAKVREGVGGTYGTASNLDKTFTIYELSYSRVQSLAETQTAILRLHGQGTNNRISPLEQFSLAGPDAVRAYPVGQVLKDVGEFASVEYQVQAPGFAHSAGPFSRQWGDLLQLALFGDYAYGVDAKDKTNHDELSGYGAGIHFGIPGNFTVVFEAAKPLSSRPASDGDSVRFYGNISVKF